MIDPSVKICDEANIDCYTYFDDKIFRNEILYIYEDERDHYLFLQSIFEKYEIDLIF